MNKYLILAFLTFFYVGCTNNNDQLRWTFSGVLNSNQFANERRDIWIIGDSYCGNFPARWTYHIAKFDSLGKFLFINESGARSDLMFSYLKEDLKHNSPKYLVWTLGMNDNTHFEMLNIGFFLWRYYFNKVEAICKKKNIQLIVCTIPNVPITDNSKKNDYIRHNFKNYIDFDSLVNNGTDRSWRRGWLEDFGQGIHPSVMGANKMAIYFKKRFSEITNYAY